MRNYFGEELAISDLKGMNNDEIDGVIAGAI